MDIDTPSAICLLALFPLIVILGIFVLVWAWNTSISQIFNLSPITKKQAFALLILFAFLCVFFNGVGNTSKLELSAVSSAIGELNVELSSIRSLLEKSLGYGSRKLGAETLTSESPERIDSSTSR